MKIVKVISVMCLAFVCCMANAQNNQSKYAQVTFQTNGTCEKCKAKIENNVALEKGVKEVNYDLKTSKVTVTYQPKKTNEGNIKSAIENLGFKAQGCAAAHCQKSCCSKAGESGKPCCKKDGEEMKCCDKKNVPVCK